MKQVNKLSILVITTLLAACGTNNYSWTDTGKRKVIHYEKNAALTSVNLSKVEITRLDHEYLAFSTKALTINYMRDKLTFLLGTDNGLTNASKIITELEYYRIKGESVAPFQAMILAYPALYTAIKAVAAVITKRNAPVGGPFVIFISGAPAGNGGVVTTLAGSGSRGVDDGPATSAQFFAPSGVALDSTGNVYVADLGNDRIRKITAAGVVSTFSGSTSGLVNGPLTSAEFNRPQGLDFDSSGNLFIADKGNNVIRKITPAGEVSTLAGQLTAGFAEGNGTNAMFWAPQDVAVDSGGNVYVADLINNRIRKITPAGEVSTFAGNGTGAWADGPASSAMFQNPRGIAADSAGNIYVSDTGNNRVRKITPSGNVTTLAGNGLGSDWVDANGTNARFFNPYGVTVDSAGIVYVSESNGNKLRKITPSGDVTTLAGNGTIGSTNGTGTNALFHAPAGMASTSAGIVYVADTNNHRIRKIE